MTPIYLCLAFVLQTNANTLQAKTYEGTSGKLLYCYGTPDQPAQDKKYPLVLFLHGAGERGQDNQAQMKHCIPVLVSQANRVKYPCYVLVPQCPKDEKWVDVSWSAAAHRLPKGPSASMKLVLELLEKTLADPALAIDPDRIYVAGLSMGGFGTWDLLARKPQWFAAGIPICGGGDPATAEAIQHIPLRIFHGDKDTTVPVARSREMVAALKKAQGKPEYIEYAGVAHDSWTPAFKDPATLEWLFAQKRTPRK
jgi:predicted peptidase